MPADTTPSLPDHIRAELPQAAIRIWEALVQAGLLSQEELAKTTGLRARALVEPLQLLRERRLVDRRLSLFGPETYYFIHP